jgi:hypothetical protein
MINYKKGMIITWSTTIRRYMTLPIKYFIVTDGVPYNFQKDDSDEYYTNIFVESDDL